MYDGRMDTHENAASAIVQLQGIDILGRPAKVRYLENGKREILAHLGEVCAFHCATWTHCLV